MVHPIKLTLLRTSSFLSTPLSSVSVLATFTMSPLFIPLATRSPMISHRIRAQWAHVCESFVDGFSLAFNRRDDSTKTTWPLNHPLNGWAFICNRNTMQDQPKCLTISRIIKVKNETSLTPSLQCPCSQCCCTRWRPAGCFSELQYNFEHSKEKSLAGCLASQGGHRRKMKIVTHLSGLLLSSGTPWPARHVYPTRLVAAPCWSSRSSGKYKCRRSFICKKTRHRYNLEAFNRLPSI